MGIKLVTFDDQDNAVEVSIDPPRLEPGCWFRLSSGLPWTRITEFGYEQFQGEAVCRVEG
jgi:hypothetical protein